MTDAPHDPLYDLFEAPDEPEDDEILVPRSALSDLLHNVVLEITLLRDQVVTLNETVEHLKADVRYLTQWADRDGHE